MQELRSSNPPMVTGICDPNKSRARHHLSLKIGLKLKYLNFTYHNYGYLSSETKYEIYRILNKHTENCLEKYMINKYHKQNKPASMLESMKRSEPI